MFLAPDSFTYLQPSISKRMAVIDHVGTSACEKSMFLVQLVESSLFPTMELRSCYGGWRFQICFFLRSSVGIVYKH